MTLFQRIVVAVVIAALACVGMHEAREAAHLREQVAAWQLNQDAFTSRIGELETALASAKAELAKANQSNDGMTAQMLHLRKQDLAAAHASEQVTNVAESAALSAGEGTNSKKSAMSKMMKLAMEQQMATRLAALKTKLNLSPEQAAAIQAILAAQADKSTAKAQQMFEGDWSNTNDLAEAKALKLSQDEQIKALLSPEQADAYDAFQQEERVNNLKMMANFEVMGMQNSLHMDPAQQDRVLAVLVQQNEARLAANETPGTSTADLRGQMQLKADALRPLLSPEQFESYQAFQEQQLKMVEAMRGK